MEHVEVWVREWVRVRRCRHAPLGHKGPVIRATFFFNFRNNVALQVQNAVARITTHFKHCHAAKFRCYKLKQHVASSWTGVFNYIFFQLAATNFVAWQCLRWVVIRPTTLFNFQCNNVALQVAAICCSYYSTLKFVGDCKAQITIFNITTSKTLFWEFLH